MADDQELQKEPEDSQTDSIEINVESMTVEQLKEALETQKESTSLS